MNKTPLEVLAGALPVDPDDGTLPIDYTSNEDADQGSWSCTWGMPETVAAKQIQALEAAGYAIVRPGRSTYDQGGVARPDLQGVILKPGEKIRPADGVDL